MSKDLEAGGRRGFSAKDYEDPPPAPLIDAQEFAQWSLYRAIIADGSFGLDLIGAAIAAIFHQFILRAGAAKALGSFASS